MMLSSTKKQMICQKNIGEFLIALTIIFIIAGTVLAVLVSTDNSTLYAGTGVDFSPIIYMVLAIAAMVCVMFIKPSKLAQWWYVIYAAIILTTIYLMIRPYTYPNVYNTIYIWGEFGIKGADVILFSTIPLSVAFYKFQSGTVKQVLVFGLLILPVLLAAAFLSMRFYGTLIALSLITTMTVAIFTGRIKVEHKRWFALMGIPFLAYIFIIGFGMDTGIDAEVSKQWLDVAKWFGAADIAHGTDNILHNTAGAYALVGFITKLGIIPGIILILAIIIFIILLYKTALNVHDDFAVVLSMTACNVLAFRFVLGILNNFNLVSAISIKMPFLSWGGSSVILDAVYVGIILSARRLDKVSCSDLVIETETQK